jgi:uncharacterized protein
MKTFAFALEAKQIDETGEIEGLAAGYGNVDHGGDIIIPGALTKSVQGKSAVPMLLFHDQKRPVGVWRSLEETSEGLKVKGRFAMSTRAGKEAHALVGEGAIGGLSIGYVPIRHKMNGRARELHEVALHEVSLVTIPMNEKALITSVKDILDGGALPPLSDFERFLCEAGGFSNTQAKAIASHGLKYLHDRQREAGSSEDDATAFMRALLGR